MADETELEVMETVKTAIIESLMKNEGSMVMDGKEYTTEQLVIEIENETDVGKKFIRMVISGTPWEQIKIKLKDGVSRILRALRRGS